MNKLLEILEQEREFTPNDPVFKEIYKSLNLGYIVKFKVNGKQITLKLVDGEILEY